MPEPITTPTPVVSLTAYASSKRRQAIERRLPPKRPLATVLPLRPSK